MIKDAKRHQRSFIITLLDLKNAFGEVPHNLIKNALAFHHVPDKIQNIVNNVYKNSMVQVSANGVCTPLVEVERGVLQGGPCSPVLFNLCFNTLMVTVADKKYQQQLGYMWSTTNPRAWMQFADDAALIAHDVKGAQALLDLSAAWCSWANMKLKLTNVVRSA